MAQSRRQRWDSAVSGARKAFETLDTAYADYQEAMSQLVDLQEEYQDWYDNMPEQLQDGATGEKLQEIINLDLEVELDLGDIETAISEAEEADLPNGFGRD